MIRTCSSSDLVKVAGQVVGFLSKFLQIDDNKFIRITPIDVFPIFEEAFNHFDIIIPLFLHRKLIDFCSITISSKN
jgi:hypothetical protein